VPPVAEVTGLCLFGRINALARRLEAIPNRPVDIIIEPVYKECLRRARSTGIAQLASGKPLFRLADGVENIDRIWTYTKKT